MTNVKSWEEMVGKTILRIDSQNDYQREAIIFFTDGTFVVIDSESDYESGFHNNIKIAHPIDNDLKLRAGMITEQEYDKMEEDARLGNAKAELERLKKNYPQLFTP